MDFEDEDDEDDKGYVEWEIPPYYDDYLQDDDED